MCTLCTASLRAKIFPTKILPREKKSAADQTAPACFLRKAGLQDSLDFRKIEKYSHFTRAKIGKSVSFFHPGVASELANEQVGIPVPPFAPTPKSPNLNQLKLGIQKCSENSH